MPAQAVLYNRVAQPMFSFGAGPYNSVVWSPHGRFVCLGGFGNLVCSLLALLVQKYKCQPAECPRAGNIGSGDASLRQFTCFTGTKVQILAPEKLRARLAICGSGMPRCVSLSAAACLLYLLYWYKGTDTDRLSAAGWQYAVLGCLAASVYLLYWYESTNTGT
jgi:hypothetical protein